MAGIQHQVRNNALELQEYITELTQWEKEIKQTDAKLKSQPKPQRTLPPVRGSSKSQTTTQSKPSSPPVLETRPDPQSNKQFPIVQEVQDNKKRAADEKDRGNDFYKREKYEEAIECYTKSVSLDPTAISYANRAQAYIVLKNWEKAERDCTEAILIDSKYVKAFIRRGTARKNIGKYIEAIADFQQTLNLEPGNKQAIEELSKLEKYKASQKQAEKKKVVITEVESEIKEAAPPVLLKKEPTAAPVEKPSEPIKPRIVEEEKEEKVNEKPKVIEEVTKPKEESATSVVAKEESSKQVEATPVPVAKEVPTVVKTMKIELPKEPPTTAYEFESFWNSCKSDRETFFHYFKMIPPQKYAQIFKSSMNADILSSIISILNEFYLVEYFDGIYEVLRNLVKIERFQMNAMFMSKKEKEVVNNLIEKVIESGKYPKEEMIALKPKYGIKQ